MSLRLTPVLASSFALIFFAFPSFVHAEHSTAANPVIAKVMEGQIEQTKIGDCPHSKKPILLYNQIELSSAYDGNISIAGFSSDGSSWSSSVEIAPGCSLRGLDR